MMTKLYGSGNTDQSLEMLASWCKMGDGYKETDTFPNYNWMLKLGLIETAQIMFCKYHLPNLILKENE